LIDKEEIQKQMASNTFQYLDRTITFKQFKQAKDTKQTKSSRNTVKKDARENARHRKRKQKR